MIGRRCKIITFENVDEAEKKSPNKFGFRTTILIICTVIVPLKVVLDYRQNLTLPVSRKKMEDKLSNVACITQKNPDGMNSFFKKFY